MHPLFKKKGRTMARAALAWWWEVMVGSDIRTVNLPSVRTNRNPPFCTFSLMSSVIFREASRTANKVQAINAINKVQAINKVHAINAINAGKQFNES